MLRITFCWTHLSGYSSSCFRALSGRPNVDLKVLAFRASRVAPFDEAGVAGYRQRLLSETERGQISLIEKESLGDRPDVLVISGWSHKPYNRLARLAQRQGTKIVLAADTPLRFDWRQRWARLRIGRYLKRFNAVAVPGERGFQLMRYWGIDQRRIFKVLYGMDFNAYAGLFQQRIALPTGWPRRFVFAGRLASEKGIRELLTAYGDYRASRREPWPLAMLGVGPFMEEGRKAAGVTTPGFIQPSSLGQWLLESGVFVLPSLYEPWGVALVEGAAAGLPVLCTDAVGASAEVARDHFNGLVVPAGSAHSLTAALQWFHDHPERLEEMGGASRLLAKAFSADLWAERWVAMCGNMPSQ